MANADPMVAATREGGDHRLLVSSLAITQTVGYGVLSYAFAVFLTPMARDLHASPTAITGALTLAVLVSAAAAVPLGRWIDQHGGRTVMVGGSILGTLAVLAWSQVDNLAGVLSVTGRIVTTGLRRRLATTTITAAVFVLQALGAALLPAVGVGFVLLGGGLQS